MAKVKTFRQILSSMVDWITSNNSSITNFFVGGVLRSILESIAIEIESLYYQMTKGFREAAENSTYNSFGFPKLIPNSATGNVKITFKTALTAPLVIPVGYRLSTIPVGGQTVYFDVTSDVLCPIGTTEVTAYVKCTQSGLIGNVPANTIRVALSRITQIQDITNENAFIDGRAQESDEERKKRFSNYITTLSRGTVDAIQYGCLLVPEVAGAAIDDQIGVVKAYVHNANGDLPESVRDSVRTSLINYRAAGIEVLVLPVLKRNVDLTITLSIATGFDKTLYSSLVHAEVVKFLNGYTVGKSLVKAELIRFIMTIDMSAITNTVTSLEEDMIVSKSELVRPGIITIAVT